ncbi:MAG: ketoacyl-ACP synthase III, partial [Bdellovibrionota bacterium]
MIFHIPDRELFIVGPASALPSTIVDNEEFLRRCGMTSGVQTRAAWIEARTGIRERRWATETEATSDLAVAAAEALFREHPTAAAQVRHLVLATISGDHPTPPTSPIVQNRLGLTGIASFDVGAACAGFLMGLHVAGPLALAGDGRQLVIAADIRSKFLNLADLSTAILFGDGAAACLVGPGRDGARFRLLGTSAFVDGNTAELIVVPSGGTRRPFSSGADANEFKIQMKDGAQLFMKAIEGM